MAKTKNIEAYCSFCAVVTKMEVSGVNPADEKVWAKCKKCKQTMLIEPKDAEKVVKLSAKTMSTDNLLTYSPKDSFEVGDTIFHQKWDDCGVVLSKESLADGKTSITVDFQKSGLKKLLTNIN